MAKSGNPARRAQELKISQVGDFKKRVKGVFELPSGLVVKLRNPGGLKVFLESGLIPNSLMATVKEALEKGTTPEVDGTQFLNEDGGIDPELMADMVSLMNNIAVQCFVEPKIHVVLTEADLDEWNAEHPEEQYDDVEDLRDDEILYADELPDDDKMFVFQWLTGGTNDLTTFRQRSDEGVVALAESAKSRSTAKPAARTRAR